MNSLTRRRWDENPRAFWMALAINVVWINISEISRYFVFIMPMMRDLLSHVPNIPPMNVSVFLIWGVWDTITVVAGNEPLLALSGPLWPRLAHCVDGRNGALDNCFCDPVGRAVQHVARKHKCACRCFTA
jgi:hypothetical protein